MKEMLSVLQAKFDLSNSDEACGIILKDGTVLDCENISEDPTQGFVIPATLMLEHEDNLFGTWHTHPGQNANLSMTDDAGFKNWSNLKHFIIGTDGIRCFAVKGELIVEEKL